MSKGYILTYYIDVNKTHRRTYYITICDKVNFTTIAGAYEATFSYVKSKDTEKMMSRAKIVV